MSIFIDVFKFMGLEWRSVELLRTFGLLAILAGLSVSGCGGGTSSASASNCSDWPDVYPLADSGAYSNVKSVLVINDCSLVVAGYDHSSHGSEPEGDSRGFVRRLDIDSRGEISERWTYWLDTNGTDAVLNLEHSGEDVLFLGVTSGVLPGQQSYGEKDVVAGRLDKDGRVVSLSQLGNERPNVPLKWLRLDNDVLFVVGSDEPYIPTNYVARWEDPWIARVTELGGGFLVNWWQNADTEQEDIYTAGAVFGPYLLLARYTYNGASAGALIEALDHGGGLIWQRRLSPSPYDVIADLEIEDERSFLAFGTTYLQLGDRAFGSGDYFLQRLDLVAGEPERIWQWGSEQLNWASHLVSEAGGWMMFGETSPELFPWSVDVYSSDGEALPALNRSVLIGESTQLEDVKPISGGVIAVGYFARNASRSVGYIACFK